MSTDQNELVLANQSDVELDGSDTSGEDLEITPPYDPSKIRVETKNTQMDAVIKRIRNNEINLSPDFQRQAGVWTPKTQSQLIESMLMKIPLPAFYMDATDDSHWLVVDGLQRLTTVKNFVVDKVMALQGLEYLIELNGKKFDEIPRHLQRRIEETDIVIYQIQPGTPDRVKFDIFKRINTGGAPLSAQEIRHALNQGKITPILKELAESVEFKNATDKGVASKRMDDRECVLRFLAFSMTPAETYNADRFDQFLNDAMAKANKMEDNELEEIANLFKRTMKLAKSIFGNDAFRKRYDRDHGRYPVNKALFEAWSVNLGKLTPEESRDLISKKDELLIIFMGVMSDSEFEQAISQGTGSTKRVRLRFEIIEGIIKEVLSC